MRHIKSFTKSYAYYYTSLPTFNSEILYIVIYIIGKLE